MSSSSSSGGSRLRVLVLTFYYPPDLSACSFRVGALIPSLLEKLPPGTEVDVITTLPNRYRTFSVEVPAVERMGGLTVRRVALPAHASGMVDQVRAFAVFVRAVSRIARDEKYDLVFATSGRLMTAALGAWIARRKKAAFYADIRDIFVDTISDVLPGKVALPLKPLLSGVERFAVSRADKVNLVSEGFANYFRSRYPRQKFSFFTNGIDEEFIGLCPPPPAGSNSLFGSSGAAKTIRVLYAGNMGEGQGLHHVMPGLARTMRGRAEFRLIGDGGRRRDLSTAVEGLDNVEVIAPMDRASLIEEYRAADVLFLHLNNYDAFKKVLPSKIFEYAATGKPIWAGVAGYSADFLREQVENAVVFPPLDVTAALTAFDRLRLECVSRAAFVSQYSRRQISAALAADIVSVVAQQHG